MLNVEARIHKEAEEIEVWSQSYPMSLQTVWIGSKQVMGQMQIDCGYSNPIAEISVAHTELCGMDAGKIVDKPRP